MHPLRGKVDRLRLWRLMGFIMAAHLRLRTPTSPKAKAALGLVSKKLQDASRLAIVPGSGRPMTLPEELRLLLTTVATALVEGKTVTVLADDAELTTQEAAEHLGMSRQYLVRLLEEDALPYHKVGTHRRLRLAEVQAYGHRRDARRRRALDKLAKEVDAAGLYFPKSGRGMKRNAV